MDPQNAAPGSASTNKNEQVAPKLIIASTLGVRVAGDVIHIRCPRCRRRKEFRHFGVRLMDREGVLRNQSWCSQCRAPEGQPRKEHE